MGNAVTIATNHSDLLPSELCSALRQLEQDAQDCWSPSRLARLTAERAELTAEMVRRGFEVSL